MLRTLKARPKPNLDLTSKRKGLTDVKTPTEDTPSNRTDTSSVSTEEVITTGSLPNKTNAHDEQISSLTEEDSTFNNDKESSISLTKLKPRPKPNLGQGTKSCETRTSQTSSPPAQDGADDCIIVGVSYTDHKASNSETGVQTANDNQNSLKTIPSKLKSRPKPNLISFNRSKRPPLASENKLAPNSNNNNKSSPEEVKNINESTLNPVKTDSPLPITLSVDINTESNKKTKLSLELNTTANPVKLNIATNEKKKKKTIAKKQKIRNIKLDARLIGIRLKLQQLIKALKFLDTLIVKQKKRITMPTTTKKESAQAKIIKKNLLKKKKIYRMIKIRNTIKQKMKCNALNNNKMSNILFYKKLLRIVIKEIRNRNKRGDRNLKIKSRKPSRKTSTDLKTKATALTITEEHNTISKTRKTSTDLKLKETALTITEECNTISTKVKAFKEIKEPRDVMSIPLKKRPLKRIRCKINPLVTEPSGVKSMRIQILKEDENSVESQSSLSLEIKSKGRVDDSRNSTKESTPQSSPNKEITSPTTHSRKFNMNSVKPNLATANRNFKPIQYTTSYGKLNNAVKQKFKDKFGKNKPPEHSKLTMLDLIFYNPSTNPMSNDKDKKKELTNEIEITNEDSNKTDEKSDNGDSDEDSSEEQTEEASRAVDTNGLPVPQLKITPDGKVIIAPESLIVPGKNDAEKNESRPLIVENDLTHHKVINKKSKLEKKNWTFQETLKFYKVLNETGSDFLSMAAHFPNRTRNCLKRKFKREEKTNGHLIDKVIGSRRIDFCDVEKELALNQMWDEVERSCKRRSKFIPEIPDVNKCSVNDMFLTKKEKELKVISSDKANKNSDDLRKQNKIDNSKNAKSNTKRKKKRRVVRLKEYLSNNSGSKTKSNENNTNWMNALQKKCLEDNESIKLSSDEETETDSKIEETNNGIPIVVNTRIESSGIKYTKSITFNPGNMDLPVDINETIAHTSDQVFPSASEIIDEIVDILSTEEKPSSEHARDQRDSTDLANVSEGESADEVITPD